MKRPLDRPEHDGHQHDHDEQRREERLEHPRDHLVLPDQVEVGLAGPFGLDAVGQGVGGELVLGGVDHGPHGLVVAVAELESEVGPGSVLVDEGGHERVGRVQLVQLDVGGRAADHVGGLPLGLERLDGGDGLGFEQGAGFVGGQDQAGAEGAGQPLVERGGRLADLAGRLEPVDRVVVDLDGGDGREWRPRPAGRSRP